MILLCALGSSDDELVIKCPCCGADMLYEREIEKSMIYKCKDCGLTDSRMKGEATSNRT